MKQNKYLYLYIVQGRYSPYGWEDLTASESRREARDDLKAYRENETGFMHRMIRRRESNPEHEPAYQQEQEPLKP